MAINSFVVGDGFIDLVNACTCLVGCGGHWERIGCQWYLVSLSVETYLMVLWLVVSILGGL